MLKDNDDPKVKEFEEYVIKHLVPVTHPNLQCIYGITRWKGYICVVYEYFPKTLNIKEKDLKDVPTDMEITLV